MGENQEENQLNKRSSTKVPTPVSMDTNEILNDAAILKKKKKAFEKRIEIVNNQLNNTYSEKHDAPFSIFIERVDFQQAYDLKNFSDFSFGKKLSIIVPELIKDSYYLKKSGLYRFSNSCKLLFSTNSFVKSFNETEKFVDSQSWKAYIPKFKVNYATILEGVDSEDINCDDILKNLLPFNHVDSY